MALIVVGGQAKHVGKTTLVCSILQRFASHQWTAAKITSHLHEGTDCKGLRSGLGWSICEQISGERSSDTTRYLKAGAVRSLLVCAESQVLAAACAALKREISSDANAIVESTSAAELLIPNLFLLVLNPEAQDFKPAAKNQRPRANALILTSGDIGRGYPEGIPVFHMRNAGLDPALAIMIEPWLTG